MIELLPFPFLCWMLLFLILFFIFIFRVMGMIVLYFAFFFFFCLTRPDFFKTFFLSRHDFPFLINLGDCLFFFHYFVLIEHHFLTKVHE